MNNKIVFGSYIPRNSVLHHLDPRVKLLMCIAYVIMIFLVNSLPTAIWLFLVLLLAIKISKIGFRQYWRGVKPLFWVIMITVIFQILFSSGGQVYWHWGIISITHDGMINSLIIFYRFIIIIVASTVLTATTPTFQIADALAWLMQPLAKIKVPVNQITLMLSIALRFIPTIMDETTKIMKAQRSRGMNFNEGNLITRLHHLVPILIPLFVNSFKRAEELATAMEARGYDPTALRSHYHRLVWKRRDSYAGVSMVIIALILISLRIGF